MKMFIQWNLYNEVLGVMNYFFDFSSGKIKGNMKKNLDMS